MPQVHLLCSKFFYDRNVILINVVKYICQEKVKYCHGNCVLNKKIIVISKLTFQASFSFENQIRI